MHILFLKMNDVAYLDIISIINYTYNLEIISIINYMYIEKSFYIWVFKMVRITTIRNNFVSCLKEKDYNYYILHVWYALPWYWLYIRRCIHQNYTFKMTHVENVLVWLGNYLFRNIIWDSNFYFSHNCTQIKSSNSWQYFYTNSLKYC